MKKNIFNNITLIIILIFVLLFSGCIQINIKGEIDPSFLVTYQGEIELNLSDYQYSQQTLVQENLLQLCDYWKSIGFDSQVEFNTDAYYIYFKKQVQCQSYEQAFEVLFNMMTDEYSPFSALSYTYIPYENYSDYIVSGSLDISNAFDMDVYNSLNDEIKSTISNEMQDLNANIEFIIPHQDSISQSPLLTKTYSTQIQTEKSTQFDFQGRIYNSDISSETKILIADYNSYSQLSYVLAGFLAILLILTIIVVIKLNKK